MGHNQPHRLCIIDNITFASEAEGRRYVELKNMKKRGTIADFEIQPKFPLLGSFRRCPNCGENQEHIPKTQKKSVIMCHKCGTKTEVIPGMVYIADFKVIYPDGKIRVEDVKGTKRFLDPTFVHKKKWFFSLYSGIPFDIVVMPALRKKKPAQKSMNEKRRKLC